MNNQDNTEDHSQALPIHKQKLLTALNVALDSCDIHEIFDIWQLTSGDIAIACHFTSKADGRERPTGEIVISNGEAFERIYRALPLDH